MNASPSSHVRIIEIDGDEDAAAFKQLPKPLQDFLRYEMPHPTCSCEMLAHFQKMGLHRLLMELVGWRYQDSVRIYDKSYPAPRLFKVHDHVIKRRR